MYIFTFLSLYISSDICYVLTYFRFPRDPYKRKVWLAGLGLLNWEPPETAIVCSYHFTEDDFVNCTTKRYLKETAIPTSESMPNEPVNNVSPVSEDANSTYSVSHIVSFLQKSILHKH